MKKIYLIALLSICLKSISIGQTKDSIVEACDLNREVDQFTEKVTYNIADAGGDISYVKVIEKGVPRYYLSIWKKESGIYTGKGVILILENGKKIEKPNETVDYTYSSGDFYTKIFMKLNTNDIALLKESGIAKFKIYITEGFTNSAKETTILFNCLVKAK